MKRILSIIVILALAIGLAACGNKSAEKKDDKKNRCWCFTSATC